MTALMPKKSSWIDQVVYSTRNVESPERYFWWSSAAAIAAAVRKRVWLSRGGHYNLYPNIYVALVSSHSGLRKGHSVSLIAKILNQAEVTRVIDGRSSIQAVLKEFSTQITLENGKVFSDAQGILVSGEFDTMLIKDPDALTLLTALYNTHEHGKTWKNQLKGSGIEELRNPCISLLVASNEVLFDDFVKTKDIEGGFIARTFIVHESKRRHINPLVEVDPDIVDTTFLSNQLKDIAKVEGEYKWTDRAKAFYIDWYQKLCETVYEDSTGSINRLGDSVLKVAMIVNLADRCDLLIHLDDLQLAIEKCETCLSGVRKLTRSSGISDLAPATKRVLDRLLSAPGYEMQRKKLLQKVWPDVDHVTLDRVLETLKESGALEVSSGPGSIGMLYRLTKSAVQMFTKFMGEKE